MLVLLRVKQTGTGTRHVRERTTKIGLAWLGAASSLESGIRLL